MTPGQQALLDGFLDNLVEHGQLYARTSPSPTVQVFGIATMLRRTDPRIKGAQDRTFILQIAPDNMPSPRLAKGHELNKGHMNYRVAEAHQDEASTIWEVLLTPSFTAETVLS